MIEPQHIRQIQNALKAAGFKLEPNGLMVRYETGCVFHSLDTYKSSEEFFTAYPSYRLPTLHDQLIKARAEIAHNTKYPYGQCKVCGYALLGSGRCSMDFSLH